VERSSSVSESAILEFMDSDLLRRGSRELRRLLSAMGERDLSPLLVDDGGSEEPGVEPGAEPGVEPGVEPGPEPGVEPDVASPERLDGGDSGNGVADPSEGVGASWPPCPSGREPLWDSESSRWSIKGDHRSLVVSNSEAAVSAAWLPELAVEDVAAGVAATGAAGVLTYVRASGWRGGGAASAAAKLAGCDWAAGASSMVSSGGGGGLAAGASGIGGRRAGGMLRVLQRASSAPAAL